MSSDKKREKMVIIGGGPAGLSAAIYGARAGHAPLVINGPEPGGQITTTSEIENYPGFPEAIGGFEYIQKVTEQAEKFGARLIYETVISVNFEKQPSLVTTDGGDYEADTVIIATGASPRKLGIPGERKLVGRGVSYCATCDGAFFKDKEIAVVGGGNVALDEALFLTKYGSRVYLIHRRDELRANKILGDRAKENPRIEILWNSEVREVLGEDRVQGIVVENNKTGEKKKLKKVRAFFVAVGYHPNVELFQGQIEVDDSNHIITNKKQETNKPGVYAAGDVQSPYFKQAITSAGSGAKASIQADRYLTGLEAFVAKSEKAN